MEEYINKSKISGDIFRFLYANKQSSRQEISQSLGISLPTTTRSLNVLQESGFIENAGEFQCNRRKKSNPLSMCTQFQVCCRY